MTFEEYVNDISGEQVLQLMIRFAEVDGSKLQNELEGMFTWGQDEVDLSGSYLGNLHGNGIRWAAFLYLKYVKHARKEGTEPGPFVDLWNADDDA